jgi:hypothetical protein
LGQKRTWAAQKVMSANKFGYRCNLPNPSRGRVRNKGHQSVLCSEIKRPPQW